MGLEMGLLGLSGITWDWLTGQSSQGTAKEGGSVNITQLAIVILIIIIVLVIAYKVIVK